MKVQNLKSQCTVGPLIRSSSPSPEPLHVIGLNTFLYYRPLSTRRTVLTATKKHCARSFV